LLAGYRITVSAAEGNVHWVVSGSLGLWVAGGQQNRDNAVVMLRLSSNLL
jgi:hypothetical protein